MKYFFLVLMIISFSAFAGPKEPKKNLPINESGAIVKKDKAVGSKAQEILKDTEDCDEKAEKAREVIIEPEAVTLGGNTGCSLDEI